MSWSLAFQAFAWSVSPDPDVLPYPLGGPATAEGAKLTIVRLLEATMKKDDAAYDRIARGMTVMLAPDFGQPVDRADFERSFTLCTPPHVIGSRPFPNKPGAQAVRITMRCTNEQHPVPADVVADIMANDEHAFMIFRGGVEKVWLEEEKP